MNRTTLGDKSLLYPIPVTIVGEIIESYCKEKYLTGGNPDVEKMKPAVFSMCDNRYFSLGKYIGKAWSMGKKYKPKNSV